MSEKIIAVIPEDIEATDVVAPARAANCHFPPVTPKELPELNPIQPHHRTNSPAQHSNGSESGSGAVPLS
jgi:hypothetical protein